MFSQSESSGTAAGTQSPTAAASEPANEVRMPEVHEPEQSQPAPEAVPATPEPVPVNGVHAAEEKPMEEAPVAASDGSPASPSGAPEAKVEEPGPSVEQPVEQRSAETPANSDSADHDEAADAASPEELNQLIDQY